MAFSTDELELLRLARLMGGVVKIKDILNMLKDHNVDLDALITYLKSIHFKIPTPLESKIADLERRVSVLEGRKQEILQPPIPPLIKEWTDKEIEEYLDECAKWHKPTYLYYKILTETPGKISRKEILERLGELLGEKVSGYSLAGIQAGITMSVTKHKYERLDWKNEDSQQFSINEKYREKLRDYFKTRENNYELPSNR